jgi:MoxR-like ATPase
MLNSQAIARAHDTATARETLASPLGAPKGLSTPSTAYTTTGERSRDPMTDPHISTDPVSDQALWQERTELNALRTALSTVYRGDGRSIDLVITAFMAGGHVLLEDIPGVGKTTLARALAGSLGGAFGRIQCTPDLMPADVTGVSIYDESNKQFTFHAGPVFCDILLADELNRTPPRTQAALLEAMSEGQVTVDGQSLSLAPSFFCIATQNPLDHVGTYPLPDSQRDRFLLSFGLGYPERDLELDLLSHDGADNDLAQLKPVLSLESAQTLRQQVRQVHVADSVRNYILDLIGATRGAKGLDTGASPRAALGLQRACQARALLAGRSFVTPDDVQQLASPALTHRVCARIGQRGDQVIQSLVESLDVPR